MNQVVSEIPVAEKSKGFFALCTPIIGAVLLGYLTLGLSLAVLPRYVHHTMGFGNVIVGVVIGLQSAGALITRHFAGTLCDLRGSRRSAALGLTACSVSGLVCMLSTCFGHVAGLGILLVARFLLGLAESLLIVGSLSWGIALVGPKMSGKVMAWTGIAMYGAIAAGAPIAMPIEHAMGINGVFLLIVLLPVAGWFCINLAEPRKPLGEARVPFYGVLKAVWKFGTGMALGSVGFGVIASFVSLYFADKHWTGAGAVLTTFGVTYIAVRLCFADLPDRLGGARVAAVSLVIEVAGQALLWLAPNSWIALAGAALTGAGFSLVFPSFGVEAVKHVTPETRGVALGAYVAFFDLAMGTTGPAAGLVANYFGYPAVYFLGGAASVIATLLALSLTRPSGGRDGQQN